jgi:hypothetical protein
MLYREIFAVCSQVHIKRINTLSGQKWFYLIKTHFISEALQCLWQGDRSETNWKGCGRGLIRLICRKFPEMLKETTIQTPARITVFQQLLPAYPPPHPLQVWKATGTLTCICTTSNEVESIVFYLWHFPILMCVTPLFYRTRYLTIR